MTRSALLLLVLGCTPDPSSDPVFEPETVDPVVDVRMGEVPTWRIGAEQTVDLLVKPLASGARLQSSMGGGRGRPNLDQWVIRPSTDVRDPSPYWQDMKAYVQNARSGVRGGEEARIPLAVHQHVQLTRPGRYALQLTTDRIDDHPRVVAPFVVQVAARDPKADQQAFDAAVAGVEAAKNVPDAEPHFQVLMALGSEATLERALEEVVDPDANPWWATILHTHPDRDAVLAGMDSLLARPDVQVSLQMMNVVVAMKYNQRVSEPMGRQPPRDNQPLYEAYREGIQDRQRIISELRLEVAGDVMRLLPTKTEGRGTTLATVSDVAFTQDLVTWRAEWLQMLRAHFHEMPGPALHALLLDYWSDVKDPAMVPGLVKLASTLTVVGDQALLRLRNLDADAFEAVATQRLATGVVSDAGERALTGLDSLKPAAIEGLVKRLEASPSDYRTARLVARYARLQDMPRVVSAFERVGAAPTPVVGAYVAAFMTHDVETARVKAMLDTIESSHPTLLLEIAQTHHRPVELLPLAMDGIASENSRVNMAAAEVLAEHGQKEFRPTLNRALYGATPSRQTAVVIALFTARNWTINKADRDRLDKLIQENRAKSIVNTATIVTDDISRLRGRLDDDVPVLTVNRRDYVGKDAIMAKLIQLYPAAPVKFEYTGKNTAKAAQVIEALAEQAGLGIYVPSEKNKPPPDERPGPMARPDGGIP